MPQRLQSTPTTRLALACIALLCIAPSLIPIHTLPIPSFYEEWTTAALALLSCGVVLWASRAEVLRLPICAWPLAGFACVLGAQLALSPPPYAQQTTLALLYTALAIAMVWCGMQLRALLGPDRAAKAVAAALLGAGVLSAVIALLQAYAPAGTFGALITRLDTPRVFGNLGQANLLANQLAVAGASLLFLWASGGIGARLAIPIGGLLIAGLSLTGSRSVWLYILALLVWTFVNRHRTSDARYGRVYGRIGAALIAAVVLLALVPFVQPAVQVDGDPAARNSAFERLAAMRLDGPHAAEGLRGYFWRHAWEVARHEPLLGAGIGQFAASFIQWPPISTDGVLNPVERNAHNIGLHLLAETGVIGLLCFLAAFAAWAWRIQRSPADLTRWWFVAAVGLVLLHSQLEYPLWHAHFLAPFALVLGLSETHGTPIRLPRVARVAAFGALAAAAVALASLLHGYLELRTWVYLATESNLRDAAFVDRQREAIRRVRASLLAPYAELPLAGTLAVNAESLAEKLALNERAMRFAPIPPIVLRHVVFLTLAGQHEQARRLFEIAARFYPRELPAFAADLERLRARGLAMDELATYVASRSGNN